MIYGRQTPLVLRGLAAANVCIGLTLGCAAHRLAAPTEQVPTAKVADAMVVGTIHRGHLLVESYPLVLLDSILTAYAPDLVLVEIRPESFARGHLEDGPIEMGYVTWLARSRGIAVEPIDWYLESNMGVEPKDNEASVRAYEQEVGTLDRVVDSYDGFREIHSIDRTRQFLKVENARARYGLGQDVGWHQRQSWFNFRSVEAIARHRSRRVAAFVGFAHRPELQSYLRAQGMSVTEPTSLQLSTAPLPSGVAAPVVAQWREGLLRLRATLESTPEPGKGRMRAKIRYWEVAVEKAGGCCVTEQQLRPAPLPGEIAR